MGHILYYGRLFIALICLNNIISAHPHQRNPVSGFQATKGKRSITSPTISDQSSSSSSSSASDENLSNNLNTNNYNSNYNSNTNSNLNNNNNLNSNNYRRMDNLPPNGDVTITLSPFNNNNSDDDDDDDSNENDLQQYHQYDVFPDYGSLYSKRAPMGFMGMRGKKDSELAEFQYPSSITGWGTQDIKDKKFLLNYPIRYIPKRAPSGFMGMRGKKLYRNDYDLKRAPSGFMGMRGKKQNSLNSFNELISSLDNDSLLKYYQQLKYHDSNTNLNNFHDDLFNYDEDNYDFNYEKRAPSGFVGMRGKKSFDTSEQSNEFDDVQEKRAPTSGFVGMRGKKDTTNVLTPNEIEEMKRAPAAGFFGMRGKKQPMNSAFFGTRGKKGPYEFRDKFVGVRGKKNPDGTFVPLHPGQQRMRLFRGESEFGPQLAASQSDAMGAADKRVPSGFYGVRGKKWIDNSSSAEQN